MSKLRLAFMGTPGFAVPALRALVAAGHEIAAVYSQPPKPAGRGQHLQKSPVQLTAEETGLPVRHPKTLRDPAAQKEFADLKLDAAVVVAYGLILPKAVIEAPRLGCLNIHASLLPRWRGAAPIQRAILADDRETGVTIMQIDEGLDTGAMLLHEKLAITPETTTATLHDALSETGARLIVKALGELAAGKLKAVPQPAEGVTHAAKLAKEEGRIDWQKPASAIDRQIRALQPWPGSFFMLGDEPVKVLVAEIVSKSSTPGTLLDEDFTVACGEEALRLLKVQRAGKAATDGASLLRGLRLPVGHRL